GYTQCICSINASIDKHNLHWLTFETSFSVLSVRWSEWCSLREKSLGDRMAGIKNRRKMKLEMAMYGMSCEEESRRQNRRCTVK
ncbi:MAG: hypothetical protein MPK62_14500, partial [Alphaproteobacteria bacterium]|nr:hypothetical protein [Alphaproteobacteria bacterium]